MQRYIIRRLGQSVLAMLVISIVIFSLVRVSGNVLDYMLPQEATQEMYDLVEKAWGLDKPVHIQYLVYMGNLVQGDLGESGSFRGKTVSELIASRFPSTLQLSGFALLISTLMAVPIGVIAAVKKDTPLDYLGKIVALIGQSAPAFAIGLILMWIFAVELGWLPASGKGGIKHMILPGIALGWFQVAALMRLTRSSMLEVLDSEYVKLARIKGVPEWKVIWKHCFRNALIVPLTYMGLIGAVLITGAVVTETVFAWPGLGLLVIEAIITRDYLLVQGVVLFFTAGFILINLLVDIVYAYVDPRIRYA
ncbi:MAG: ABC transporter permease [Dehalococcoidia bacterium]|nr:ABC transporter permease [Dehalococcoidia bacterium]